MNDYVVSRLSNEARIRAYLLGDPDYAAYALADLEPPYAQHTAWFGAYRADVMGGLALVYSALKPSVLFLMGCPPAIGALLRGAGPGRALILAPLEAEDEVRAAYHLEHGHQMRRMRVTATTFRPPEREAHPHEVQPLSRRDMPAMLALIHEAARYDGRESSDIALTPEMVEHGVYRGVREGGLLIAMAGTHIIARAARLAAVGNVVVHPAHRRRGLGRQVTQAVTSALLEGGIERVVLNVRDDNNPAVQLYKQLGYKTVNSFIEALGVRSPPDR